MNKLKRVLTGEVNANSQQNTAPAHSDKQVETDSRNDPVSLTVVLTELRGIRKELENRIQKLHDIQAELDRTATHISEI